MKDLTRGKPVRVILEFALPLYIGLLFSSLYGVVDTRIIGSILGAESLAAVGATTALSDLLLEFTNGIVCGFGIVIARYFGAHDEEGTRKAVGHTFSLGILLTVALSLVTLGLLNPILGFMRVEAGLYADAHAYIAIIIGGLIASSLYNICAAVLRAIGDSFTPLIFLIASNIANVALDYLFVGGLRLGVRGAAWATVLTQALSAGLCFGYMAIRYPSLRLRRRHLRPERSLTRKMLPAGVSMGFMLSFVLLGSLILQASINALGQGVIVAHTGARKITLLLLIPFFALGSALSTYCGQNSGAKLYPRLREGIAACVRISAIWWCVSIVVAWTLSGRLTAIVTASEDAAVIGNATRYLRVNASLYILPALICILRNSMQGFGDTRTPLISSVIELIGKALIAFLLVPVIRYAGVIVAEPIVWSLMVVPLLIKWKKDRRAFM